MNKEEYDFLQTIKNFMYVSTFVSKEDRKQIYVIYNRLTGEKKQPNGCAKCFANVTRQVKHYFERYTPIQNKPTGHGI